MKQMPGGADSAFGCEAHGKKIFHYPDQVLP